MKFLEWNTKCTGCRDSESLTKHQWWSRFQLYWNNTLNHFHYKKKRTPSNLVAKTKSWDKSEELKLAFIAVNQIGTSRMFVFEMYTKTLTISKNEALKLSYELKQQDPTIKGFVRLPVSFTIKIVGKRKCFLQKDF